LLPWRDISSPRPWNREKEAQMRAERKVFQGFAINLQQILEGR
jgi:hypothetical protein